MKRDIILIDFSACLNYFEKTVISKIVPLEVFTDICLQSADNDSLFQRIDSITNNIMEVNGYNPVIEEVDSDDEFYLQMAYESVCEKCNEFFDINKHPVEVHQYIGDGLFSITTTS